jgi:hypothetical protein
MNEIEFVGNRVCWSQDSDFFTFHWAAWRDSESYITYFPSPAPGRNTSCLIMHPRYTPESFGLHADTVIRDLTI